MGLFPVGLDGGPAPALQASIVRWCLPNQAPSSQSIEEASSATQLSEGETIRRPFFSPPPRRRPRLRPDFGPPSSCSALDTRRRLRKAMPSRCESRRLFPLRWKATGGREVKSRSKSKAGLHSGPDGVGTCCMVVWCRGTLDSDRGGVEDKDIEHDGSWPAGCSGSELCSAALEPSSAMHTRPGGSSTPSSFAIVESCSLG